MNLIYMQYSTVLFCQPVVSSCLALVNVARMDQIFMVRSCQVVVTHINKQVVPTLYQDWHSTPDYKILQFEIYGKPGETQ